MVCHWLRHAEGTVASRRIVRILNTARKLQELSRSDDSQAVDLLTWRVDFRKLTKKKLPRLRRGVRLARELRALLGTYTIKPELIAGRKGQFYVRWKPTRKADTVLLDVSSRGDRIILGEGDVLLRIVELARVGSVDRVRRCAECSKWFFARIEHQAYCDRDCQQAHFRGSEHFKAHRSAYMRQYRRDERERNKRAKGLARMR